MSIGDEPVPYLWALAMSKSARNSHRKWWKLYLQWNLLIRDRLAWALASQVPAYRRTNCLKGLGIRQQHAHGAVRLWIVLFVCGRPANNGGVFDCSHRSSSLVCDMLILYSDQKECGHRRQRLLMDFGVWPETAIRLIPPHTFLNDRKQRWLLWLEDTSTDESRRAAAALR